MIRTFRLTNEPGGLGLSCTTQGVSLAGVPLLRKTEAGFAPRPAAEIADLIEAAYGGEIDPDRVLSSLDVIVRALDRGEVARAMIAAVLSRLPELNWHGAARLANAERRLAKYDPSEPRDWRGRWTTEGGAGPAGLVMPLSGPSLAGEGAAGQGAGSIKPHVANPELGVADWNPQLAPAAATSSRDDPDDQDPDADESALERKYDHLEPEELAKKIIEFGDWLGRNGANLSAAEKEQARAEYAFLQDRLANWLDYEDKPLTTHLHLLSAALSLYEGAVNGGIVTAGDDLPASMVTIGGVAAGLNGGQQGSGTIRPAPEPPLEIKPPAAFERPKDVNGLGRFIVNDEDGVKWNGGLKGRRNWETQVDKELPDTAEALPDAKTFDHFDAPTGEATSDKALNTASPSYVANPRSILSKLKSYINAMVDYEPRPGSNVDIDPEEIKSKTLQLSIPRYTTAEQWRYIDLAARYARDHGISVVVTRIEEPNSAKTAISPFTRAAAIQLMEKLTRSPSIAHAMTAAIRMRRPGQNWSAAARLTVPRKERAITIPSS